MPSEANAESDEAVAAFTAEDDSEVLVLETGGVRTDKLSGITSVVAVDNRADLSWQVGCGVWGCKGSSVWAVAAVGDVLLLLDAAEDEAFAMPPILVSTAVRARRPKPLLPKPLLATDDW